MKACIITNGCQVARLKSMRIQQFLTSNEESLAITNNPKEAELIIFYACGLTDISENESLKIIKKIQPKMKPLARIIVWGCLPKINPKSLSSTYSGPILGPNDTNLFEGIIKNTSVPYEEVSANMLASSWPCQRKNHSYDVINDTVLNNMARCLAKLTRAWFKKPIFYIRVAEGCVGHCTYCSEKLVWGEIKSQSIEKVISEFRHGLQNGYSRFYLCAEDLGAYGVDIGYTVIDLLKEIINLDKKKNYKIIIEQISPSFLKSMLTGSRDVFASDRIEALSCQVQSGSNRILKLMGRNYSAEEWRNLMLLINSDFPNIKLGTHFIVGFPTETDVDFNSTLSLLDYPLFLEEITIFKFSARPGTPASSLLEQVSENTKETRYNKLNRKFLLMYLFNLAKRNAHFLIGKA